MNEWVERFALLCSVIHSSSWHFEGADINIIGAIFMSLPSPFIGLQKRLIYRKINGRAIVGQANSGSLIGGRDEYWPPSSSCSIGDNRKRYLVDIS